VHGLESCCYSGLDPIVLLLLLLVLLALLWLQLVQGPESLCVVPEACGK
jgi:hypothetical protein